MKQGMLVVVAACAALLITGVAQAGGGDAALGETKAAKCAACHGPKGEGKRKNPPIAGLDPAAFVKSLHDYKSGVRKNVMMKMATKKLSDKDFADLAAYYAVLK